jgi:Uma2 family endonuclease
MSAESIEHPRHTAWQPDPMRQRLADHTLEDVLNLPLDAPRVELVDGVMLVVPSPTIDHQAIASLLWAWLRAHSPHEVMAVQAVGVAVHIDRTYEPDVLLIHAGGEGRRHYVPADQVVLAVEVVSPHTKARDRFAKPAEYAAAGIPYYWRVEQEPLHIYAYRRNAEGTYDLAADAGDVLELTEPFEIRLPVAEIAP